MPLSYPTQLWRYSTSALAISRWCATLGLSGAGGLAACDWVYLGQPISGSEAVAAGLKVMLGIPGWRLVLGGALGVVFGALYLFGFWHVRQALAPAGKWLSFAVFVLFS